MAKGEGARQTTSPVFRFCASRFPQSSYVLEESGLPWGVLISPYAAAVDADIPVVMPSQRQDSAGIPRCSQCGGYLNLHCRTRMSEPSQSILGWIMGQDVPAAQRVWECVLCYHENPAPPRLADDTEMSRSALPELSNASLEMNAYGTLHRQRCQSEAEFEKTMAMAPRTVLLVDGRATTESYIGIVEQSLQAAVEGLKGKSTVSIMVFTDRLRIIGMGEGVNQGVNHIKTLSLSPVQSLVDELDASNTFDLGTLDSRTSAVDGELHFHVSVGDVFPETVVFACPLAQEETVLSAVEAVVEILSDSLRSCQEGQVVEGFTGSAFLMLVEYLESTLAPGSRIECILTGPCEGGYGTTLRDGQREHCTGFFQQLARRAAEASIVVDLFGIVQSLDAPGRPRALCMDVVAPFAKLTGGTALVYSLLGGFDPVRGGASAPNNTELLMKSPQHLSQDLFRRVSGAMAFQCLLRIRTTPHFHVLRTFGNRTPLGSSDCMLIPAMTRDSSIAVEFTFSNGSGFRGTTQKPVFQVAYSFYEFQAEEGCDNDAAPRRRLRGRWEGRLRLFTVRATVAVSPRFIFSCANAEVNFTFMVYELLEKLQTETQEQVRGLLFDSLVKIVLYYNKEKLPLRNLANMRKPQLLGRRPTSQCGRRSGTCKPRSRDGSVCGRVGKMDPTFSRYPNLQVLPR